MFPSALLLPSLFSDAGAKLARTAELQTSHHASRALRMSPSASLMAASMLNAESGSAAEAGAVAGSTADGDSHHSGNGGSMNGGSALSGMRLGDLLPSKLEASITQRTYSAANFAAFPLVRP